MPSDKIKLSPKHGINPAIPKCFYCGGDKNLILLVGKLPGDVEAPRNAVWDTEPCDKCAEYMTKGVIMISVKDEDTGKDNPYRTGGWVVVTDEFLRRLLADAALAEDIIKKRFSYCPDGLWDQIGLPRGPDEGVQA